MTVVDYNGILFQDVGPVTQSLRNLCMTSVTYKDWGAIKRPQALGYCCKTSSTEREEGKNRLTNENHQPFWSFWLSGPWVDKLPLGNFTLSDLSWNLFPALIEHAVVASSLLNQLRLIKHIRKHIYKVLYWGHSFTHGLPPPVWPPFIYTPLSPVWPSFTGGPLPLTWPSFANEPWPDSYPSWPQAGATGPLTYGSNTSHSMRLDILISVWREVRGRSVFGLPFTTISSQCHFIFPQHITSLEHTDATEHHGLVHSQRHIPFLALQAFSISCGGGCTPITACAFGPYVYRLVILRQLLCSDRWLYSGRLG